MPEISFQLHPGQIAIHNSPALYKVVAAGRRFGKTVYAAISAIIEGMKDVNDRGHTLSSDSEVMYMAPTFEQAKGIFWPVLKELARPLGAEPLENVGVLTLPNNVRIRIKGMDNPDRARGFKLRHAILDEYADMHADAWDEIIQPALMDLEGGALFIGTPKGKNHFYELFQHAFDCKPDDTGFLEWEAFKFFSTDNPFLPKAALQRMYDNPRYSDTLRKQELEADFLATGDCLLRPEHWVFQPKEPVDGYYVVVVDLAGFSKARGSKTKKRLDDAAISVVKIHKKGWWVKEIVHGQWDVRETALRIILAAKNCAATAIGIERGALMNAVLPYMDDVMAQYGRFFHVKPLTHGNQQKELRIQWALQGRLEKKRIQLNCQPGLPTREQPIWVRTLLDQGADFPSHLSHDDLIDSLAYTDQMGSTIFMDYDSSKHDIWTPQDEITGV